MIDIVQVLLSSAIQLWICDTFALQDCKAKNSKKHNLNLKLRQSYGVGASCDYPLPTETTLSLSWEPLQSKQAEVYQRERIPERNFIFLYVVKKIMEASG